MLKIIAIVIISLFIIFSAYLWIRNTSYMSGVEEIQKKLKNTSGQKQPFSDSLVKELPETARLYLTHAIEPGTILAEGVELKMKGSIKTSASAQWMPFEAVQNIKLGEGFVWKPIIRSGSFLRIRGVDYYYQNESQMYFALYGLIPIVNATGEDIARSAAGRFLVESIWLPTQFLPSPNARWLSGTDSTASVELSIDGNTSTITLDIEENGSLKSVHMLRYQDSTHTLVPFGGFIDEEREFNGYRIPAKVRVGWFFKTPDFAEFFRAEIIDAKFY